MDKPKIRIIEELRKLPSARAVLKFDGEGNPSGHRLRLAVTSLLWEMACADGNKKPEEKKKIEEIYKKEFEASLEDADREIELAEASKKFSFMVGELLEEAKERFSSEQRVHLLELLLDVAKVDAEYSYEEEHLADEIRDRLDIYPDFDVLSEGSFLGVCLYFTIVKVPGF